MNDENIEAACELVAEIYADILAHVIRALDSDDGGLWEEAARLAHAIILDEDKASGVEQLVMETLPRRVVDCIIETIATSQVTAGSRVTN